MQCLKSNYITYLDASKLFRWAMSQHFPYGGFEWINQVEIQGFDVNLIGENSSH